MIGNAALAILAIAVMVVGLIEWAKGWPHWYDATKNPKGPVFPGWIPSVASPVLCLLFGQLVAPLVLGSLALLWLWGIVLGLLGLAVTELCYQILVQSIPQVIQAVLTNVVGGAQPQIAVKPPGS